MAQASSEKVVSILPGGLKLVEVEVSGMVLTEGVATVTLGSLERITQFIAAPKTQELTADYVVAYNFAAGSAANQVAVTVKKIQLSATNTWGAAETADVSDSVVSILAIGY